MRNIKHWERIRIQDGHRVDDLFDKVGIPLGFVVDGNLSKDIKNKIKADAIPLKPGGKNFKDIARAQNVLRVISQTFMSECFMIIVPYKDSESGFFARHVIVADFQKTPDQIKVETYEALDRGDIALSDMKACVWLALTGETVMD